VALFCQAIPRFFCKNNTYFSITITNVYFDILRYHHNLFPRLKIRTTRTYPLVYCNNKNNNFVSHWYVGNCTRKNANLEQTCSNYVPTNCQQDVFVLLVPSLLTSCQRLLSSTDLLQVVLTTCYRPAIQQFVNKLGMTTL
jgi:hypothetical protein